MRAFQHSSVRSADEAVTALRADTEGMTSVIAGGAELLSLMKANLIAPTHIIDLKPARELRGVTFADDGSVRIGALTTLADIERDATLAERLPILPASVREAATPQLRNMATVGGNLMQRNRCWYFRGPYTCWQKGGDQCFARGGQNKYHAIFDESPCVAVHPSDLAPALLALEASVMVVGPSGERTMALSELLRPPTPERRRETTLASDDVITAVTIPAQPTGARGVYLKVMDRQAWAYALVSAAAQISLQDGRVERARLVLGGVANTPHRLPDVERALEGQTLTPELAAQSAERAIQGATPLEHNAYKVQLARELTRRAILQAAGLEW
ncbi:MAG TPA: xanthine dehydrogenase family protein subunit M [Ktedonobacterales bacterium]|jgi:xanthine dehydrogenase YagS FAD-binding subunit|nr:xanthine dehydrogenase family protein subunit M [Ktedonobacterales bacterium]